MIATTAVMDNNWTRTPEDIGMGNLWVIPLVIIAVLLLGMVASKKPGTLLALGFCLVVVVPLGSCILR